MNDHRRIHDAAARAFAQHATDAKSPSGRARSLWSRRVEPWLVAGTALLFVAWALAQVLMSR